jgi:hypothetical protein
MSGGGGSGSSTQRIIQDLPEWSKPYYTSVASAGRGIAREKYRPFPEQQIAGFTGDEGIAFKDLRNLHAQGARPELDQARGIASQASQIGFDTPMFPDQAGKYMNPYMENILGLGQERLAKNYKEALGDARKRSSDAAIQSGIMGGRGTLMGAREAGEVSDEAFRAMREFEADTRFRAFEQAQQAFGQDVQNRQAGARLGLDAGSQLQNLAAAQQAQALERIGALQQSGVRQREMEQAIIDQAYNDFIERRDHRKNQLNWFTGLLSGTPLASAMNTTQLIRGGGGGPGIGQTIAGLGIAGAGALGSYYGAQS